MDDGMEMAPPHGWTLGARVRIREDYWDPELAGRPGTVASAPEGVAMASGSCWIEFEVEAWRPGVVEAAELPADSVTAA